MVRYTHMKARECLVVMSSESAGPEKKAAAHRYLSDYIQNTETQEKQLKEAETRLARANRIIKPITGRGY